MMTGLACGGDLQVIGANAGANIGLGSTLPVSMLLLPLNAEVWLC